MHFSALAYVGESVTDPLAYYHNNTAGTISLLRAMKAAGVRRFVFSSTCAIYGEPEAVPDRRDHAAAADQPLRLVEVVRRAGAARLRGRGAASSPSWRCATSTWPGPPPTARWARTTIRRRT